MYEVYENSKNKKRYRLTEDAEFYFSGGNILVSKGFTFASSVPRNPFIKKKDIPILATLKHDVLYKAAGNLERIPDVVLSYTCPRYYTRKQVDYLFWQDCKVSMKEWKANLAYSMVSLFGWVAWKDNLKGFK